MTVQRLTGPAGPADKQVWNLMTDLDPQTLTAVGMAIAARWIEFAMGSKALGGKMLAHPTGRYAAAIEFQQRGESRVAIIAREGKNVPESALLETGHRAYDMKPLFAGRAFPLHRGAAGPYAGALGQGYGPAVSPGSAKGAKRKQMWVAAKAQGFSGVARVGGDPDAWVIPAMPAFSPAASLVALMVRGAFNGS